MIPEFARRLDGWHRKHVLAHKGDIEFEVAPSSPHHIIPAKDVLEHNQDGHEAEEECDE